MNKIPEEYLSMTIGKLSRKLKYKFGHDRNLRSVIRLLDQNKQLNFPEFHDRMKINMKHDGFDLFPQMEKSGRFSIQALSKPTQILEKWIFFYQNGEIVLNGKKFKRSQTLVRVTNSWNRMIDHETEWPDYFNIASLDKYYKDVVRTYLKEHF